ncbi:multicopper oxidase family protein [Halapricum desulfuricans]|uniref:Multicopper oxidase n=1 Tax=Halapricum desulfuricans TaxID=2841257 RepID=A0A897N3Z6_9EURY|nr:multicopper oxidase family protein [Halapricum desulfuricans]QSG07672.1 Multicopper oxidase [Halapricum desulfuricans]
MTRSSTTRRRFLAALGAAGLGGLTGCTGIGALSNDSDVPTATPRSPPSGPADTAATVRPAPAQAASGLSPDTWIYNEGFPGPQLRVPEGDVLEVELANGLPRETTVHWHGVPVANPMDGVPGVTQQPAGPGESFTYRFRAEPAGTYFFHSHVGLQLDRGLLAPLIVEESDPHVEYDREYTVVLDDYLDGAPQPLYEGTDSGGRGPGMGGGGPGMGGMMGDRRPPYAALLANGRPPNDPQRLDVREGQRVRVRFINASSATYFRVRLGGHPMTVTHADGRPVDPVAVDSFRFGAGERYDVVVDATNPGTWELLATALNGRESPARALLSYDGGTSAPVSPSATGRELSYGDLVARTPIDGLDGSPDRTFNLTLSAGQSGWLIDGQAYPDADPLQIKEGEHVRVTMRNRSPVVHPMHLHGHFFQVGNAVKDTVVVPGHMGTVTFDFLADNPGNWLFHCHNLYHLESGMARLIQYIE